MMFLIMWSSLHECEPARPKEEEEQTAPLVIEWRKNEWLKEENETRNSQRN